MKKNQDDVDMSFGDLGREGMRFHLTNLSQLQLNPSVTTLSTPPKYQTNSFNFILYIMTEGRQSPPPERQAGDQQRDPQAKPNDTGAGSGRDVKADSAQQLKDLSSNPTHPLEKEVEKKFGKSMPPK